MSSLPCQISSKTLTTQLLRQPSRGQGDPAPRESTLVHAWHPLLSYAVEVNPRKHSPSRQDICFNSQLPTVSTHCGKQVHGRAEVACMAGAQGTQPKEYSTQAREDQVGAPNPFYRKSKKNQSWENCVILGAIMSIKTWGMASQKIKENNLKP